MSALITADGPISFDDAVLIDHTNMAPTISWGGVVFFMPRGWRGWYGTFYGFDGPNMHPNNIYRVDMGLRPGAVSLGLDGWPKHCRWQVWDREDFMSSGPGQVAGIVSPHTPEFGQFLIMRFREGAP